MIRGAVIVTFAALQAHLDARARFSATFDWTYAVVSAVAQVSAASDDRARRAASARRASARRASARCGTAAARAARAQLRSFPRARRAPGAGLVVPFGAARGASGGRVESARAAVAGARAERSRSARISPELRGIPTAGHNSERDAGSKPVSLSRDRHGCEFCFRTLIR